MSDPLPGDRLSPRERHGLRPSWITYRHELNAAEQENLAAGFAWGFAELRRDILGEAFLRALHKRMFGKVWRGAGQYRTSDATIGIEAWRIPEAVRLLVDDARQWRANRTYDRDESAVRFHHWLVLIHPFPTGNGRHARLMADLLVGKNGGERFTWGRGNPAGPEENQALYAAALSRADANDLAPLIAFARS